MLGKYRLLLGRRRRAIRNICVTLAAILLFDLVISIRLYKIFNENLALSTVHRVRDLPDNLQNQRIYIVAQFWTSRDILQNHWQDAVLRLIDTLGPENVHLSILATKGMDDTDEVLQRMEDEHLAPRNISRTIVLDSTTHEDVIRQGGHDDDRHAKTGWLYTGDSNPPGRKELRRIPYLAAVRNRSLEPLIRMQDQEGISFDKILFLGDVVFEPSDVLSLLATNQGFFDVACSIDYRLDNRFYDTFVLRDSEFNIAATRYFPIFRSRTSRDAMLSGFPVPVTSCWNGMMLADAAPYYDQVEHLDHTIPFSKAATDVRVIPGLKFRGVPDSLAAMHLEGSEACLVHADLIAEGRVTKGLFLNPAVRVGYSRWGYKTTAYDDVHTGPQGLGWVTLNEYLRGIWTNRRARWLSFGDSRGPLSIIPYLFPSSFTSSSITMRVDKWKAEGEKIGDIRNEVGEYCLIDEMQILTADGKGWKHVGSKAEYH